MRTGKPFLVALVVTLLLTPLLVACPAAPPPPVGATVIQALPANLSFLGTSTATVNVTANGTWSVEANQAWLQVSPSSGTGSGTVTVTVSRSGLAASHYAGSILFRGAIATREVVTVYMRFPNVSGNISGPTGQVRPGAAQAGAETAPDFEYVPGELIVTLDPIGVALSQGQGAIGPLGELSVAPAEASALMQAASELATAYSLRVQAPISADLGLFVLETGGKSVAEAIDLLKRDGRVRSASPNYIVQTLRTPNDLRYQEQWHYPQISLPAAWNLTTGATDRVVAILDTGLDVTHSDFAGRVVPGYDFVLNTTEMSDPGGGHGTHVAGTVGAATNNGVGVAGVDWNARLMPVRVLGPTGGTSDNISRGILFAAGFCVNNSAGTRVCPNQQAQVINLSLGLPNPNCQPMPDTIWKDAEALAVAWAMANGSVIVAAAGNDACGVVAVPAAYPGVIAVAATTRINSVAPYSNWGPQIWIAAPGGDQSLAETDGILSTLPGNTYGWLQGTSMAAPHVAGIASLMLAANRDLTPWLVKQLLRDTATDLDPTGWDQDFGHGLVHAERAVQAARNLLVAHHSDFIVRIRSGATVVAETRADRAGNFRFENIPAGSYTIEAGTDVNRNGVLGEPGEFFGSQGLTVSYVGDVSGIGLNVQPR